MFLTSDEQEDFRQAVRQMCEDKVAPHAAECDEKAQYPWHAHEAFSAMGLMGLTFPEDCGGSGADHGVDRHIGRDVQVPLHEALEHW